MNTRFILKLALPVTWISLAANVVLANANVIGTVHEFRSPLGVPERCVEIKQIPDGKFSEGDIEKERAYCAIDLYASDRAICPKTWSTSPGTIIVSLAGLGLTPAQFEATRCSRASLKPLETVKFKPTMNEQTTSSTFSQSSILYYEFSRYFDTAVDVPVAVMRTISRADHLQRVSSHATGISKQSQAGWAYLQAAEQDPTTYKPTSDLFTDDRTAIYGAILKTPGAMYGPEINGAPVPGSLRVQAQELQNTPAFIALKSPQTLKAAIQDGVASIATNPAEAAVFKAGAPSDLQMIYWMRELSEISILDYIFDQQDRPTNIDVEWKWTYVKDGKLESLKLDKAISRTFTRVKISHVKPPAEIAAYNPVLLERTMIGDNDSGGRANYSNMSKITGMVTNLRHIAAKTYSKLIALDRDYKAKGPQLQYLSSTFGLEPVHVAKIVQNVSETAEILKQACRSGSLHFDLEPKNFALQPGVFAESPVNCDNP